MIVNVNTFKRNRLTVIIETIAFKALAVLRSALELRRPSGFGLTRQYFAFPAKELVQVHQQYIYSLTFFTMNIYMITTLSS